MDQVNTDTTILLNKNSYNWNPKVLMIITITLAILLIANALYQFASNNFHATYFIQLVTGVLFLFQGLFVYSPNSKFSPKIHVGQQFLIMKSNVFAKKHKIDWSQIKEITFGSYEINITLIESNFRFKYNSSSQNSLAAKKIIRETAESKGIEVISG